MNEKLPFVSAIDFFKVDPLKDGDEWGPWHFDAEYMRLYYGTRDDAYGIRLWECGTSEAVLDWILQLSGKGWVNESDLGHLVRALDDIFQGLQGKVCPGGLSGRPAHTFDSGEFIQQRLKDNA